MWPRASYFSPLSLTFPFCTSTRVNQKITEVPHHTSFYSYLLRACYVGGIFLFNKVIVVPARSHKGNKRIAEKSAPSPDTVKQLSIIKHLNDSLFCEAINVTCKLKHQDSLWLLTFCLFNKLHVTSRLQNLCRWPINYMLKHQLLIGVEIFQYTYWAPTLC